MKLQLSTSHAVDLLRQDEYAGWSYKGATALVEHLETLEEDLGEEITFNCIDFRCEFSEYKSVRDWLFNYYGLGMTLKDALESAGIYHEEDEEEIESLIAEFIRDRGTLVEFEGGVIVSSDF